MYRIAIVDDNDSWCFVMTHRLHQEGYIVSAFTDASSFLYEAEHFDLALIDFSMPSRRHQRETDGPDLIRQIRQSLAHPPIMILISSYFTNDILNEAADICPQADACFGKSISSKELIQEIEKLLMDRVSLVKQNIHRKHQSQSIETGASLPHY